METPHNIEAEQQVLGCIIKDPACLDEINLQPADFYHAMHQEIYRVLQEMHLNMQKIDLVTVADKLSNMGTYTAQIAGNVVTTANVKYYSDIVKEKSKLRQLIDVGRTIQKLPFSDAENADQMITEAERLIYNLSNARTSSDVADTKEVLNSLLEMLDEAAKKGGGITGVDTGFYELNFLTAGFQKQDLIIIAARPSMGKTAFSLEIAKHVAKTLPVAIFSLEMRKEKLLQRMIASHARIDTQKLKLFKLNAEEEKRFTKTCDEVSKLKLFIDETPAISAMEMLSKCRRIKNKHGLGLVIVDYLQLMSIPPKMKRLEGVGENSRILKRMARELDCPVIALSQLNRSVEQRDNKRPMMSDLRETGELEQNADMILFIYRDEYYNKDTDKKGIAEIILAKQRDGATGNIELGWQGQYTKFVNLDKFRSLGTETKGEWPC